MAFPSSAGYGNLPTGAFSPILFSQKALKQFRKVSVIEDITNTDYFGEIANYGDTVHIMKEPEVTVTPYVRGKQLVSQDLVDNDIILQVDQANSFQFQVDDIEKKQSHLNFESLAANRAAYNLKNAFDSEVLSYMAGQAQSSNYLGSTATPLGIKLAPTGAELTPLQVMNRLKRFMDVGNIPTDERWFVADPYFWELMGDENSKLIPVNITGDSESALRNGRISEGAIRGFKCYVSNNLTVGGTGPTATSGANYGTILAGHMCSTATASQLAETEQFRSQNTFADVVRGLHLYGRKVLRPEALTVSYWNQS
jgi:hypothetical protein